MNKLIRFGISQKKSIIEQLTSFKSDYYYENYSKYQLLKQFSIAEVKLQNTQIRIIGVPIGSEDSESEVFQKQRELEELLFKFDLHNHYLIQLDPSPYIFNRRTIASQHLKSQTSLQSSLIFQQLPLMPYSVGELNLSLHLLDIANVLQKNEQPSKELLDNSKKGYFQEIFWKVYQDPAQIETYYSNEFKEQFSLILRKTLLYTSQPITPAFRELFASVQLSMLKGNNVYLGDLSQIYLRIYTGIMLSLAEVIDCFKHIMAQYNENISVSDSFLMQNLSWRQLPVEYFLLYSINKMVQEMELSHLTVIVQNNHFDPIKQVLLNQQGQLGKEVIDNDYLNEFKFPIPAEQENDEQMLEKHALLDILFEFPIWGEEIITNPFPYLSQKYSKLSPQDQKEVQKTYFKYYQKYSTIFEKVKQQIKKK